MKTFKIFLDEVKENLSNPPEIGYHITSEENAEWIMKNGLEPKSRSDFLSFSSKPVVFLYTSNNEQHSIINWLYDKFEHDREYDAELTKLKIDLRGLNLSKENGYWVSLETIKPNRITNLGNEKLEKSVE